MKIPDSILIDLDDLAINRQLEQFSGVSGIYLLNRTSQAPHLSWSANLARKLKRLLRSSYTTSSGALRETREQLTTVECWTTGSRLETSLLMAELMRRLFPGDYLQRLRLRMPWFVVLTDDASFARLAVVNRLPKREHIFGPFRTRDDAQWHRQELLGLFQLRRCTERLAPDPSHPGCMYGEMNLCMRPCQAVVSVAEYAHEAQRVRDFLFTNGRLALGGLSAARDRASEAMDFEQAAQLHKRMESVKSAANSRDKVIGEARNFHGIALTPCVGERKLKLWPMVDGYWQDALVLDFAADGAAAKSLDRELRERLTYVVTNRRNEGRRVEALALFSRWYYSSRRDGEWFAFRTLDDLNYRGLVRSISNMLKTAAALQASK